MRDVALKISERNKFDVRLNARGTIQEARDEMKLVLQVAHSVIRDSVIGLVLNTPVESGMDVLLINDMLSNLRAAMVDKIADNPEELDGFHVYRSEDGIIFERVTPRVVKDYFVDEAVENDREYFYRIVPVIEDNETMLWRIVQARPSRVQQRRVWVTDLAVVEERDRGVLFTFLRPQEISPGEVLETVERVDVFIGEEDPREKRYRIVLRAASGKGVAITGSYSGIYIEGVET